MPLQLSLFWQQGMSGSIDAYVHGWLRTTTARIVETADRLCKKRDVKITYMMAAGAHESTIHVRQATGSEPHPNIEQWAFDYTFTVPAGGFAPAGTQRVFAMPKPEGLVYRARTYTRHKGETYHRKGYMQEAVRHVLSQSYMDGFSYGLAILVGNMVADKLRAYYTQRGYTVL